MTVVDLPAWAASIVTAIAVVWWVVRLIHAQQQIVLADIREISARHTRELAERDARIDRLEAEAAELRDHVRRCEDETAVLRRLIAELERALGH